MNTILIVGATSAIAEETAKLYAGQGQRLVLWGRNLNHLHSIQNNLEVLGAAEVYCFEIDLDVCGKHADLLEETVAKVGAIDIALIAHGVLPDQQTETCAIKQGSDLALARITFKPCTRVHTVTIHHTKARLILPPDERW